jgi:predicted SAM-dependent methyltransferase
MMPSFVTVAKRWVQHGPVPLRLAQEVKLELHLAAVRLRGRVDPRWRRRLRDLRGREGVKLHFGCGGRILPGWLNVDGWDGEGVDAVFDLRQPLPLRDASCRMIFTEHVLEHIDQQFRPRVLRELCRVLEPGGTLRVSVPHSGKYAEAYVRGDLDWFQKVAPGCATRAEGLNDVFVGHFHRFIDDFESLGRALREAGFSHVEESEHQRSALEELRVDSENEARKLLNLYVEARK